MNFAMTLTRLIQAVAPIEGVSIGQQDNKATWRVDFRPEATPIQKAAAQIVIAGFDPDTADIRSDLAKSLDTAISAMPPIDPRIKAVLVELRKQQIS